MKVFIIFLSLLLINLSFLVYQSDMSNYMRLQKNLKAISEEGAAGAALYFDEEEYSEGRYVFKYDEGKAYVNFLLEKSKKRILFGESAELSYNIEFEDDLTGYKNQRIPAVTLEVKVKVKDLFRLPFLNVDNVIRKSKYELPE